jgi:hypothetical protein
MWRRLWPEYRGLEAVGSQEKRFETGALVDGAQSPVFGSAVEMLEEAAMWTTMTSMTI